MAPNDYLHFRPHPWHGLKAGPNPPETVTAYIEITPFDLVKYEVDKQTGYLSIDRPQLTSSSPPSPYGFIPRTYCGERVGQMAPKAAYGDKDPMDICVISERPITHSDILLTAHVIGGFQMIDDGLADDKIIAVLQDDPLWCEVRELNELPTALVERLRHYFLTYKLKPGSKTNVRIDLIYGRQHALKVIEAAIADYKDTFGDEPPPTEHLA